MKKIKLLGLLALTIINSGVALAQPGPYGQLLYPHTVETHLGTGKLLSANSGFLMTGYRRTNTGGQLNIIVEKLDTDGSFNFLGTTDFSEEFYVTVPNTGCSGATSQIANCYGAAGIENDPGKSGGALTSGVVYLAVGTTDLGVFLVGMDATGSLQTSGYYRFPVSTSFVSKPCFIQFSNPSGGSNGVGTYYICGSYTNSGTTYMYILQVDDSGNYINSIIYDTGSGTRLEVNDIIESPYATSGSPELILIGTSDVKGDWDGFLMDFDDNSFSYNSFRLFDYSNSTDIFSSINIASSTTALGQPGYIIGGYTTGIPSDPAWMTFINRFFAVGWSSHVAGNGASNGRIVGVIERHNGTAHQYFGICTSNGAGTTVVKLDDNGAAFGGQDQFRYVAQSGEEAKSISFNNNNTGPNYGIQIFGNSVNAGVVSSHLIQACFNGATGCTSSETLTVLSTVTPLMLVPNTSFSPTSGNQMSSCSAISIIQASGAATANQVCAPTVIGLPAGGSNARTFAVTSQNEIEREIAKIYPNPASETLILQTAEQEQGDVSVALINELGQLVKSEILQPNLNAPLTFDLDLLSLNDGLYFLQITIGGKTDTRKLIIDKREK